MKKFVYFCLVTCLAIVFAITQIHAQTVYVTNTGKKYHAKNCNLAKTGKKGMELKAAVAAGYGPCTACKAQAIKEEKKAGKKKTK